MESWTSTISMNRFFHVASLVSRTAEAGGGWLPKIPAGSTPPEHLAGVTPQEMEECTKFLHRMGYTHISVRPHRTGWEISAGCEARGC